MNKQEYFNEAIQKIEDFTDYPTINLVLNKWETEPRLKNWYSVLRDGVPTQIIHWEEEIGRVYVIEISPTKVDFFIKYTREPLEEIPDQIARNSINEIHRQSKSGQKKETIVVWLVAGMVITFVAIINLKP